jgi:hypothetical protein
VQPVDESVRLVELVTQAGHPAPGNHGSVTVHPPRADFGRFHLLGDFVDVHVQRLKQLPRLRGVGVIDHVGIIAPTTAARAPEAARQKALPPFVCRRSSAGRGRLAVQVTSPRTCQRGAAEALASATIAQ